MLSFQVLVPNIIDRERDDISNCTNAQTNVEQCIQSVFLASIPLSAKSSL